MNKQEIFNTVCEHLMKQKAKARAPQGGCNYLAADGKKCAVGCLIPKELYNESIEGVFADFYEMEPLYKKLGIHLGNVQMLSALQFCHDSLDVSSWKQELKRIALRYHLKQPECIK